MKLLNVNLKRIAPDLLNKVYRTMCSQDYLVEDGYNVAAINFILKPILLISNTIELTHAIITYNQLFFIMLCREPSFSDEIFAKMICLIFNYFLKPT